MVPMSAHCHNRKDKKTPCCQAEKNAKALHEPMLHLWQATKCHVQAASLLSLFGITGVTTEKELLSPENKVHPDYYTDQLPDLLSVKEKVKA